jgi:amino acid transporter
VLAVLFAVLAAVNVRGVTPGAGLVEIVTAAKLVPLVALVLAGVWFVRTDYLIWTAVPSVSQVGHTAIVLIFAFVGVEVALVPGGEVRDPARTVPRALFLALASTTTLYLLVQGVAQGLLGPSMSAYASAPLAEASGRVLGTPGRLLVLAGGTISMFGYVSGDMLGTPRAVFALARDGILPNALARIHPRFRTPSVAIVTYAAIVATLAISSSFTQLAILANVGSLSLYLLCVIASYELQRRDVRGSVTPFTTPGGPLVPILAAAAIVWLLSQATAREFIIEAIVLAAASGLYFTAGKRPSRRQRSSSP